jgi:anti-sigma factor RsiW
VSHPTDDLTALLDGELPPSRAEEVTRHVDACPACRAERDQLAAGAAALRALPPAPEPSAGFAARLTARLAAEARPPPGLLGRLAAFRWRIAAPVAAAALAAAVVGVAVRDRRAEEASAAWNLELLLDYETVASLGDLEGPEDAEVIAALDELAPAGNGGRP